MKSALLLTTLLLCFIHTACLNAQKDPAETKINALEKKELIDKITSLLKENYVFIEKADRIEKELNDKLSANLYDKFKTLDSFGDQLNLDLVAISGDKHLKINFSPRMVRKLRTESKDGITQAPDKEFMDLLKSENFRMRKVEILHGNIGYFKIDNFVELKYCKRTLTGALNFISNSSAIILDLSDCGGGASETMDFILSYFLPESTKIGELKFRKNNEVKEYHTVKDPDINNLTDTPLYIIVSKNTASAAEGLAACLQEYKRAVVIGEKTKGLGNPGELFVINDVLYIFITTAVSGTGLSGKNFDGKGVTPDVILASSEVFNLNKAMIEVCRSLSQTTKDKKLKNAANWLTFEYLSLVTPGITHDAYLNAILGNYEGNRKIIRENDGIYFDNGSVKRKLTYMNNGVFSVEGRQDYRIYFPNDNKPITYHKVLWFDDTEDKVEKLNN